MNSAPWRTLDFLGGVLVHGLLTLFVAALTNWGVWATIVVAAGLWCAFADRLRPLLPPKVRLIALGLYALAVGAHAVLSWLFVAFHNPLVWLLIGVLVAWVALLIRFELLSIAGVLAAAGLSVAVFAAADARLTPYRLVAWLTAAGLAVLLVTTFTDRWRGAQRWFLALFTLLGTAMGVNDVFYHGVDLSAALLRDRSGVQPIVVWSPAMRVYKRSIGLDLRFVQPDALGRLVFGSDNGLFVLDGPQLRELPLGPAGDNLAVDRETGAAFVATRDGRLSRLEGPAPAVTQQQPLPHGALVTRIAPEGVYALDEWRWIGLYDLATLAPLRAWDFGPISDLLPDGTGGFFVTTLCGTLRHVSADGAEKTLALPRLGVFHLLALDAAGTRLFVSNMASTRLTVVNAADLSEIRTVDVGRGARNLLWDEATHTLVIGLYFDGDLLVLGGDDLREVGRLHVGRRIRSLAPYGPGSIIVTSAGGAFVVRLDEAFALPKD